MSAPSVDRWPVDPQNQHKQYVLSQPYTHTPVNPNPTPTIMKSSRIMDAFCKDAARAEWMPQPTKPQKLKKKHRFSLSKRSTFGQPVAFSEDVIPVANPRRLSRAPQLDEDYRRAQGEGPLSKSRGGNHPLQAVPEPVYPLDQFAVNESTTASYRRRSWTLKPRSGAGPAKPALVTIAEFEDGELKSGFVSCAASIAYTSPSVSRSTTYASPTTAAAPHTDKEHATKTPLRSPPPPRTDPAAPPIPKLPASTPTTNSTAPFSPHPSPNQYLPQSARRPQRIFRVNSRDSTAPKRMPSKRSYPTKEKIVTLGVAHLRLVDITPAATSGRRRSRAARSSAPPRLAASPPYELPAVSSPKEMCTAEAPPAVAAPSPTTPTLTFTAPTPTPTPAPEMVPAPTRRPPPPPVVEVAAEEEKTEEEKEKKEKAERTVYKPYRAPTPEAAVVVVDEKPLPVIPPLKTGWPAWWKKEADVVVVVEEEKKQEVAVEKKQDAVEKTKQEASREEVRRTVVIPEALRIGMASRSLEARLGSWEALAAGERY